MEVVNCVEDSYKYFIVGCQVSSEKKFDVEIDLLQNRMKVVIDAHLTGLPLRGRWLKMEEKTGISARRWMNLHSSINKPSLEMLIALVRLERRFAAFLLVGNSFGEQIGYRWGHETEDADDEYQIEKGDVDLPDFSKG